MNDDYWDESTCIINLFKYYVMLFGPVKDPKLNFKWENIILSIASKLPLEELKVASNDEIFANLIIQVECAKLELGQITYNPSTASPLAWAVNWLTLFSFVYGKANHNPILSVAWFKSIKNQ